MISSRCAVFALCAFGLAAAQSPVNVLRASNNAPPLAALEPPPPVVTNELRGDILMARKMYREAIDMYRQGPADSPILANKIGIAFHQMSQLELARKCYMRAIKIDPRYSQAINNLGTIYYAQRDYGRAIKCYKRAIKTGPESASIYSNLGSAYFARKDYKTATGFYQQALQIDPDVFERHSSYGTLMMERDVEERAVFHLYMAKVYAKNGANDRALLYLRKALEEGIKDRDKIPGIPEFAVLKKDPAFVQLLAENPRPL